MTNTAHIVETALLLLAAYLIGCIAGYGIRRILHAARGTRQVATVAVAVPAQAAPSPEPRRTPSPAARLAATVNEPLPRPVAPKPRVIETAAVPAKPASKPLSKPAPAKRSVKAKSTDPKPPALIAARDGRADNLKQIKGIGPKIEASLHALGIFHIDQIAGWTKANVDWVDAQLASKGRIRRERWVEQATELAKVRTDA